MVDMVDLVAEDHAERHDSGTMNNGLPSASQMSSGEGVIAKALARARQDFTMVVPLQGLPYVLQTRMRTMVLSSSVKQNTLGHHRHVAHPA